MHAFLLHLAYCLFIAFEDSWQDLQKMKNYLHWLDRLISWPGSPRSCSGWVSNTIKMWRNHRSCEMVEHSLLYLLSSKWLHCNQKNSGMHKKTTGLGKSFLTKETNINIFGNTNIILNTSRRENSRCAALWKCQPALGSAQALLRHSSKDLAF